MGPSLGAGLGLAYALAIGNVRLHGLLKHATIGTLVEVIAGILIGASIFAALMAAADPHGNGVLHGKVFAHYQQVGIVLGIPIGAVCGITAGSIFSLVQRKHRERQP